MSRNRKRRNRNQESFTSRKVIRCSKTNRPVFEHDSCDQFTMKSKANDQKNCKNCKHAF